MNSPFYGSFDDTLLVGVEALGGSGRDLECVGCGDLIVGLVRDVVGASVVAIAFFLRRPLVGGKWRVSLAGDGENVILRAISSSSLFFALWFMSSEAWKYE